MKKNSWNQKVSKKCYAYVLVWLLLGAWGVLGDSGPNDWSWEMSSEVTASSNSKSITSWFGDLIHPPILAINNENSLRFLKIC